MALTAARVAGFGSVSHIVTVIFFWALARRGLIIELAAAPAVAVPSRARNSRRPRVPSRCSSTSRRRFGSSCQCFIGDLLYRVSPWLGGLRDALASRRVRPESRGDPARGDYSPAGEQGTTPRA